MALRTIAGRYELIEPIGSGWRARDTELERDVLVRLGAAAAAGAPTLAHPNIVRIFDQGEADGERYVVLEYLPGGTLAERGGLTEDDGRDLAIALEYAHAQGVVHGSISPATVLFDAEGRAKLADFGGPGEPEEDVRALGALLGSYTQVSPPLPHSAPEPTTLIQAPPPASPPPAGRRRVALVAAVAALLLVAGLAAALLATSGDSDADPTTGSLSVPVPTGSSGSSSDETEAPPPTETAETTTEQTTSATTATQPAPAPPPATAPLPATTTAPFPTTEPTPTPTTEPPPPTTTEEQPPTTTAESTTTQTP